MHTPRVRIGIEFSPMAVRVTQLIEHQGRRRWWYGEQALNDVTDSDAIAQRLARLLQPLRRDRLTAQIVLAAPLGLIRSVTVRIDEPSQLSAAVQDRLPPLLPFDAEQGQVAFQLRRQQRMADQLECDVVVAACEQAALQQQLEALWQAGWIPSAVVPSAVALVTVGKTLGVVDKDAMVMMEMGGERTTMVLVDSGEPIYARDVSLGMRHVCEALVHGLADQGGGSISLAEAATLIERLGLPASPQPSVPLSAEAGVAESMSFEGVGGQVSATMYFSILQPILEQLVSELRRTMTFGAQTTVSTLPQRLLISGDGSRIPHSDRWFAQQLGVPVTRLSCEPLVGAAGAAAAVACGLALLGRPSELDLHMPLFRQRRQWWRVAALLSALFMVLTVGLWLGLGWQGIQAHRMSRQLAAVNDRWIAIQPLVTLQHTIEHHTHLMEQLVTAHGIPPSWFRRLAQGFPSAVRLASLAIQPDGRVAMTGEAQGREQTPDSTVSSFALWLEQSSLCRDVQLGSTRRVGTNEELVEFRLSCQRR